MIKEASLTRMSTLLLTIGFVFTTVLYSAPAEKNTESGKVIATVGKVNVTYGELEKAFRKNMNRQALDKVSRDSINDFLNLYVNYKLKVLDAIDRGYDKDSSVQKEIETYRKVLAESFYYDRVIVEPNLKKLFDKRNREFKIAIIHIGINGSAPADTLLAYNKAIQCINLINKTNDFSKVARDSSDDKRSAEKGGEVPSYITAGTLQRPVEDAMYSLKPGQVYQKPIRTRLGYIILKLTDEQPRYKVKVRHILLSESTSKDSLVLNRKADSLITLLKKGGDFTRLVEENSDDPSSKMNGGVVSNWYSRSAGMDGKGTQLAPEFEAAIFKLKDGEVSGKVKTDYGIHIIMRDSSWKFTEEEENQYLKKTYKRLYFDDDKREYLNNLRTKFGMTVDQGNLALFIAMLDTSKTNMQKNWDSLLTNSISSKPLYNVDGKVVTINDFKNQLNSSNELKGTPLNNHGMNEALNKIIDPIVFGKATANIETEYPDFKFLMDEFKDGILLFKVEALEVWDKLKFDSTKAKEYFKSTGKVYYTDHAYDLSEIYVLSDSTAKSLYKELKNGADFSDMAEKNTQRSKFREKKGLWGKVFANDNKLAKMAFEKGIKSSALLEPVPYENGFSIVKINSYEAPRVKTFEEAIPDFAPQYQDMVQKSLTENWLKNVKTKFPVKINEVELTNILKALNKKKGK